MYYSQRTIELVLFVRLLTIDRVIIVKLTTSPLRQNGREVRVVVGVAGESWGGGGMRGERER